MNVEEVENEIGKERERREKRRKRHTVSLSSTLYVQEHTGARFYTRLLSPPSPVSRGSPFRLPKTTSRRPSYGNSPAVADAETYSAYVNPCVFTLEPRQIRSSLLTKFRGILRFPRPKNRRGAVRVSPWNHWKPIRFTTRRLLLALRPIFRIYFRTAKRIQINIGLENVLSFENFIVENEDTLHNRFGKV